MEHTFTLPGLTKSQNELDGKHWAIKHKERTYWHETVGWTARQCPFTPTRAHVRIVRVSKRLIDPLNCYAGCKWLLDAFVEMGWLRGDGYADLTIVVEQRKCRHDEAHHMEVTISYENQ